EEEIRDQLEEITRLQAVVEERKAELDVEEARNKNIMPDNKREAHRPNLPWGRNNGLLSLPQILHDIPRGLRKNFPNFKGDGSNLPEEHVVAFIISCGVSGIEYEDVS
ncbi:hypothetical protein KI387_033708, partial [Taxus chinensis]